MTRGRLSNEAFVVRHGEETAVDVLGQALTQDWIDEPAIARRAELARPTVRGAAYPEPDGRLSSGELRSLLERDAAISHTLSTAFDKLGTAVDHLAQATSRGEQLVAGLGHAEERQQMAQEVIEAYDHPVRRRLHREELESARRSLGPAASTIESNVAELAEVEGLRTNKHFTLKTSPLRSADLADFVDCFRADDRSKRVETERFRRFTYDELIARDKANLDITWLRDESLDDASTLPSPGVLAAEIVEELEAALAQFSELAASLPVDEVDG